MRAGTIAVNRVMRMFEAFGFIVYRIRDPEFRFDFIAYLDGVTFYVIVKDAVANNETFWKHFTKKEIEEARIYNKFHIIVFISSNGDVYATRISKTGSKFTGFVPLSLYVEQQLYSMRMFRLFNENTV